MTSAIAPSQQANGAIEKAKPPSALDVLKKGFAAWRPALQQILPKHIDPDRVIKIALHAYMIKSDLQRCTPQSMIRATIQCAELGLDPSPLLGEAHFIPFENTREVRDGNVLKKVKQLEVQLIPGYLGLIKLAKQTGDIADIYAVVVDEAEKAPVFAANGQLVSGFYVQQGTKRLIEHRQDFEKRTGTPFAAYGVVKFKDGTDHFEVMTRSQIEAIRDRSAGYRANPSESPWTRDTEEMWKKTVIKRTLKTVPKSPDRPQIAGAVAADTAADVGEAFRSELSEVFDESEIAPAQIVTTSRTQDLLGKLGGDVEHTADGELVQARSGTR